MGGAVEGLAAISPFPIDVRCGCGHRIRVRFGVRRLTDTALAARRLA